MSTIELNKNQKQAVDHKNGPMLVVAGAGTGKTRVIVERIVSLIENGVDAGGIVALTFTEKAAQEMIDRINESRGIYSLDLNVHTYNAFGEKLLRKYGIDIGLQPNLQLLNETSMAVFIRENLDEFTLDYYKPIGDPGGYITQLISYFGKLKQNNIRPSNYKKYIDTLEDAKDDEQLEKQRHLELLGAYETYIRICKEQGVIDYDDQIYLTLEILSTRPNILAQLKSQYPHLLVDEFQDTNTMQSTLLDMLSSDTQNIMVVGDDDQAIYGFRGASLENILDFKENYPKTSEVVLTDNYRSSQAILDSAYKLINHNNPERLEIKNSLDKKLKALEAGEDPVLKSFEKLSDELVWIAEDIKKRIDNGQTAEDLAILVRTNSLAPRLSAALDHLGIKNHIAGQTHDLFSEPIVNAIIDILRAVCDPDDNKSLYHALSGKLFNGYSLSISQATAHARKNHVSLLEAISEDPVLSEAYATPLALLESWRAQAASLTTGELIYAIITDSKLKDKLIAASEEDPVSATQIFHISQLFKIVSDYELSTLQKSAHHFIDNIDLLASLSENISADQDFEDENGVSIMTIHKSKGLEWDSVYIPGLTQGNFPGINRSSSLELPEGLGSKPTREEFIREERRLMYVAMTRAKNDLTLSMSYDHGGKLKKKPSLFIAEIFDVVSEEIIDLKLSDQTLLETNKKSDKAHKLPSTILKGEWVNLSVSQINDYQRCPADFYYRHVLGVPEAPNSSAGVGRIVHAAVQYFNEELQAGRKPDIENEIKRLEESWPKEGYGSKTEYEESKAKAAKNVRAYFETELKEPLHPNIIEKGFELKLDEHKVIVKGRYDAVYNYPDYIEIRDYKTSQKAKDSSSAKKSATASPQLTLYALAWQEMTGSIPDKLSLDYLLNGVVGSVSKKQQSLDTMRTNIAKYADAIRNHEFPLGRDHTYCRH